MYCIIYVLFLIELVQVICVGLMLSYTQLHSVSCYYTTYVCLVLHVLYVFCVILFCLSYIFRYGTGQQRRGAARRGRRRPPRWAGLLGLSIYLSVCLHVYIKKHTYICINVCMLVYAYIYEYIYIYIYIYICI